MLEKKEPHVLTGTHQLIDPSFGHDSEFIELDLGCGKGGLTMELAKRHPERLLLAADIKISRLKKINNKAFHADLSNIETIKTLGWDLIGRHLPDNSIDRIHVVCPDPWPKKNHRPNRMLTSEFIARMATVLKPGATLHLATDDLPYREWILEAISTIPYFKRDDSLIDDVKDIQTEFKIRWAKENKDTHHMGFLCQK